MWCGKWLCEQRVKAGRPKRRLGSHREPEPMSGLELLQPKQPWPTSVTSGEPGGRGSSGRQGESSYSLSVCVPLGCAGPNNNRSHLLSICYIPGTVLSMVHSSLQPTLLVFHHLHLQRRKLRHRQVITQLLTVGPGLEPRLAGRRFPSLIDKPGCFVAVWVQNLGGDRPLTLNVVSGDDRSLTVQGRQEVGGECRLGEAGR